ncbi:uncharacterized protein si:ch211-63p21.1 [Pungitius pungitius]|uniref:uncharacterized protein si:ch211-63p21.1 n=1 Tax=Pungitius pungitius TaxID=134920 RepID=UPI002E13CD07
MLRTESDPRGLFSSGGTSDIHDCGGEASGEEADAACACQAGPCTFYPEAHRPPPSSTGSIRSAASFVLSSQCTPLLCEHCGKHRVMATRFSEGYGTEEECVVSDPQGESDADADIEDTDCRHQEPGPLQRVSSRRRKRPRVARQDTTESEDDGGGQSCRTHRWTLRLSPARAHSRTIPEESVSQVRPLVILRPDADRPAELPRASGRPTPLWPPAPAPLPPSLPLALLLLLLLLPLSLVAAIVIVSLLRPRAGA